MSTWPSVRTVAGGEAADVPARFTETPVVYKVTTRLVDTGTCADCGDPIGLLHTPASSFRPAKNRWTHSGPNPPPGCKAKPVRAAGATPAGGEV